MGHVLRWGGVGRATLCSEEGPSGGGDRWMESEGVSHGLIRGVLSTRFGHGRAYAYVLGCCNWDMQCEGIYLGYASMINRGQLIRRYNGVASEDRHYSVSDAACASHIRSHGPEYARL